MKNIIQIHQLQPADRIVAPKSLLGMVQHHAIYLGKNHFGQDLIVENVLGKYVRIVTAEEFTRENPKITKIVPFKGSQVRRRNAVEHALKLMGKPYHLINFNCEHFANEVQHQISFSSQVRVGLSALVIIAIIIGLSE